MCLPSLHDQNTSRTAHMNADKLACMHTHTRMHMCLSAFAHLQLKLSRWLCCLWACCNQLQAINPHCLRRVSQRSVQHLSSSAHTCTAVCLHYPIHTQHTAPEQECTRMYSSVLASSNSHHLRRVSQCSIQHLNTSAHMQARCVYACLDLRTLPGSQLSGITF